jgi:hypothetical protein
VWGSRRDDQAWRIHLQRKILTSRSALPTSTRPSVRSTVAVSASSGGELSKSCLAMAHITDFPSRVTRPHGNSGVVKSKFSTNLPAKVFGASCRIVCVVHFHRVKMLIPLRCSSLPPSKPLQPDFIHILGIAQTLSIPTRYFDTIVMY